MITSDITILINRLQRANIPLDHLCYELDEHEWRLFCRELEALHVSYSNEERDYSYAENVRYMGMPVRKQATAKPSAEHANDPRSQSDAADE